MFITMQTKKRKKSNAKGKSDEVSYEGPYLGTMKRGPSKEWTNTYLVKQSQWQEQNKHT